MNKTIMRQACERVLRKRVDGHPQYAQVYVDYLLKMQDDFFKDVDIYGQSHRPTYDLVDAMVFADLHAWGCIGKLLFCKVYVGAGPKSDSSRDSNNLILEKVSEPFKAHFEGGPGWCDGHLEWVDSIEVGCINQETNEEITKALSPGWCPLEVGYTKFETTKLHLAESSILARWPYGDPFITLIYENGAFPYRHHVPYTPRVIKSDT